MNIILTILCIPYVLLIYPKLLYVILIGTCFNYYWCFNYVNILYLMYHQESEC